MRPAKASAVVKTAGVSAFLVSTPINIRYLTGVKLTAGLLLCTTRGFTLYVDGRYTEAAAKTAFPGIRVQDAPQLEKALAALPECGFEAQTVTVARLAQWKRKFKNTKFVQCNDIVENFRRTKEPDELRYFRRAQRITREILERVPTLLRRPISEHAVAWKIREWAMELGADDMSFEPIVAFGTHTSRPHHRPTHRVLQKGHIVQVDIGAVYGGYCADQSAVYYTARPTELQKRVHKAVTQALEECIAMVQPGIGVRELDMHARSVLKEHGFDKFFVHSLGHGVGLEVHEGPTLSSKVANIPLLKNEIVTIEPGVYLPGRFGMRLETEVIV